MADREPTDASVGYKRPPRATQFKPGQSGNPKGRPRGARNFATALEQELRSSVAVNENGKRRMISKRDAIAKQLVNKAASGDARAIPILLNEMRFHENEPQAAELLSPLTAPANQQVMESIIARIRAADPSPGSPGQDEGRTTSGSTSTEESNA